MCSLGCSQKHANPHKSIGVFQDVEDLMEWWNTVEGESEIKCFSFTLDQKYMDML